MAVYFIQAGAAGPIKIGFSAKPKYRVFSIQSAHYEEIRLLHIIPEATRATERRFHRAFKGENIRGEWFNPKDRLLCAIQGVIDGSYLLPAAKPIKAPSCGQSYGDHFLKSVEQFLDDTGMANRRLGYEAPGDPSFVSELFGGRPVSLRTADRVLLFMEHQLAA